MELRIRKLALFDTPENRFQIKLAFGTIEQDVAHSPTFVPFVCLGFRKHVAAVHLRIEKFSNIRQANHVRV